MPSKTKAVKEAMAHDASNHRNGTSGKTVLTDAGSLRIEVPRRPRGQLRASPDPQARAPHRLLIRDAFCPQFLHPFAKTNRSARSCRLVATRSTLTGPEGIRPSPRGFAVFSGRSRLH